jgi:hypothetical protein
MKIEEAIEIMPRRRRHARKVVGVVGGGALLLAAACAGWVVESPAAVASPSAVHHSQLATDVNATPRVDEIAVTLAPGASKSFKIPVTQQPVEVQIDNYQNNHGVQTPSELFSALVNVDDNGSGMSWNGTNSDGTSSVGSSGVDPTGPIVTETCPTAGCVKTTLNVSNASNGTVTLNLSPTTAGFTNKFLVEMWYTS